MIYWLKTIFLAEVSEQILLTRLSGVGLEREKENYRSCKRVLREREREREST